MRLLIGLVIIIGFIPLGGYGQQVVGGEFFINSYVDFGKGIPFALSSNEATLELDVASAQEGLNVLYLRTKNNLGIWSMIKKSAFFKYSTPQIANVIEMEYFLNTYGNFGTGKKITIEQGKEDYLLDLEGLNPGLHLLYIRVKNSQGKWSHAKKTAFFVANDELSKIVSLRYQFVGQDFESETYIFSNFEPTTNLDLTQNQFLTNAEGLEEGKNYRIKLIALNEKGQQSMVYSATFVFTLPPPLNITGLKISDLACFGGNDGKLEIEAIGEGMELEYSIDNTTYQESNLFENLTAGNYTAYVRDKDAPENKVSRTFSIVSPDETQITFQQVLQPNCAGENTGGFTVQAKGGTGTFTYKLSTQANFSTINTFADLAEGTYSILVKDANNCEKTAEIILEATSASPPKPTLTIQGTDGISTEVSLVSSSATANQWIRNGADIPGATGQSIEITQPGNYQVRVTNETGCSAVSETTVITDLREIRNYNLIRLYPNPANDLVKVKFEREFYLEKVSLVNSQGILTNLMEIRQMTDEVIIDVTRLIPGNYIVVVEGIGMNERLNLVKK